MANMAAREIKKKAQCLPVFFSVRSMHVKFVPQIYSGIVKLKNVIEKTREIIQIQTALANLVPILADQLRNIANQYPNYTSDILYGNAPYKLMILLSFLEYYLFIC